MPDNCSETISNPFLMKAFAQRPTKVLHVLNSAGGGAALSTLGLIDAFWKEGIASCAVCHLMGSAAERLRLLEATRGQVVFTSLYWANKKIRAATWRRPFIEARQLWRTRLKRRSTGIVVDFAKQNSADLIHTNNLLTPEGGFAARQLRLPHVWHIRELVGPGTPYPLPLEGKPFGRFLAEHCSKLIANSNVSASKVRDWLPNPELLEIVPNGIDIHRFSAKTAHPITSKLVVGMVGSLTSQWKKHDLIVEVAAKVDRSLPIEWRFYGEDPSQRGRVTGIVYLDRIHARIRELGLTEQFKFPGFVSDPATVMSEIDILIHAADRESFGRVIVEAMAAEIPVVGIRSGGVGEIVVHEQTGLLAESDNPVELARYVERLAHSKELREKMGAAGRRRAFERYSLDACAAGVLRVYESAMCRPVGREINAAEAGRQPT